MKPRRLVRDRFSDRKGIVTEIQEDGNLVVEWLITSRNEGRVTVAARIKEVVNPNDVVEERGITLEGAAW